MPFDHLKSDIVRLMLDLEELVLYQQDYPCDANSQHMLGLILQIATYHDALIAEASQEAAIITNSILAQAFDRS